jgi:hypothetical protein
MTSPHKIALSCFERIQGEFTNLAMELVREPEHVELEMNIPQQPGLLFDVHLNLQNVDELHLVVADEFWVEWFPCTDGDVTERYVEAVCGVLSGAFRVLAVYSGPRYLKGYLQRPRGAQWETIARHYHSFALPFSRRRKAVIQNVAA